MLTNPMFYIISVFVMAVHSFLNCYLCGILSDRTRFHKASVLVVCLINGIMAPFVFTTAFSNPIAPYIFCIIVLNVEFLVLFVGKTSGKIGVAMGSLIHLFTLRAIVLSSIAYAKNISMHEVYYSEQLMPWVNLAAFAVQLVTLTLFIRFIPLKTVRQIMADQGFYKSLLVLTSLLVLYMVYNSYIFTVDAVSRVLFVQEIVVSVFMLSCFYIMLLFLIKIFNLGAYKEKTKQLEVQLDKDRVLTSAVINYASIIIEINCTKDEITRLLINSKETPVSHLPPVTDFFKKQVYAHTHPDDVKMMSELSAHTFVSAFENNEFEKIYEYRAMPIEAVEKGTGVNAKGDEYLWYKMRVNISLDESTSDVIALLTVDEIHSEKQMELALRYKAERDTLTGAYNKNTFETKVNEYLSTGGQGTLYMFDLDNFKGINDNMGHTAGDAVLSEVNSKITALFRAHDLVARIGGDEFVIFLVGAVGLSVVQDKAQKMCETINKTYHAKNKVDIEVSCSVGISIAPKDGDDFEKLFNAADIAMYHSKGKGKNTYTIYDQALNEGFEPQENMRS